MKLPACQLCIGPVRFLFQGEAAARVRYPAWPYDVFFESGHEVPVSARVDLKVHLLSGMAALPERQPDFSAGRNWALWKEDGALLFVSGMADGRRPRFACELEHALEECRHYTGAGETDAPLRYPLDQILTWSLLGRCQGLLLHAACAVYKGSGFVFAGRSGAGKSTLSSLCVAEGWDILNDDRVIVYPEKDHWLVSGTPWHGSGPFACNRTVPLRGIYILEQDGSCQLVPYTSREAQQALLPMSSIAWFEDSWMRSGLDALGRLTDAVDVFRFRFTKDASAVREIIRQNQ